MHSYLRSIGLKKISTQKNVEDMICDVIGHANSRETVEREDGSSIVEYTMEMSESCGVKVRGEEDAEHRFHYSHFCPYVLGTSANFEEEIYLDKRVDTDAYTGMCDDIRLGVSMIFYIQNIIDCLKELKKDNIMSCAKVYISGLATEGKILLPTAEKTEDEKKLLQEKIEKVRKLFKAKNGDMEAIESLALSDIDQYAMVSERIKSEDLFSIVETSIVPYGSESDVYSIVGNIIGVQKEKNKLTNEEVYILDMECKEIMMRIAINKEDLLGEPAEGRRFRGNMWMQGKVEHTFVKLPY